MVAQAPEQVAERQHDGQPAPAWQWARTEQTRSDLLAAAREVFAEQGYTCAKVTDIAARAGLSVGSIYHHFGGKNELYLALWRRYNLAREEAAARAVARARNAGATDTAALWAAGAQAILRTTWKRRDLAALFCAGNGPPDFEDMRQQRRSNPGRPGDALLRISGSAGDPLLAAVLAALLTRAPRPSSPRPRTARPRPSSATSSSTAGGCWPVTRPAARPRPWTARTWKTCSGPDEHPAPSSARPGERIAVIIGSTRPERICAGIAQWCQQVLAEESPLDDEIVDLAEVGLPFPDEPLKPALRDYRHEHTKAWSTPRRGAH